MQFLNFLLYRSLVTFYFSAVVDIDNPSGGGNDIGLIVLEVALAIIVIIVIISAVGVVVYCCIQYKKKQGTSK